MVDRLEVRVLGPLSVLTAAAPVELPPSRKTRALLAYLAVTGRAHQRERLCEMFWDVPDDPRGSLRWSLSKIRQILSSACVELQADRNAVALPEKGIKLDYCALAPFTSPALADHDTEALQAAEALHRDGFLSDLSLPRCPAYEIWRVAVSDEVVVTRIRVLQELVLRLQDRPVQALPYASTLRALLPNDHEVATQADVIAEAARQEAASAAPSRRPPARPGVSGPASTEPTAATAKPARPSVSYCRSKDGTRIAFARSGSGPVLLRAAHWMSHVEFELDSPVWRHWVNGLSRDATLIRYDERGNGLSDRKVDDLSFDAMVSDLESVVDAAGLERFTLLGVSQSCAVSVAYAVRHPERVSRLILFGGYVKGWRARGNAREIAMREALGTLMREGWGQDTPLFRQMFAARFVPEGSPEQIAALGELQRVTVEPEIAWRLQDAFADIDVSDLLHRVTCPTLVIHARDDLVAPLSSGKAFAEGIENARFVELASANHLLKEEEPAFEDFLRHVRSFMREPERSRGPSDPRVARLVGRDTELHTLRLMFERARSGLSQLALIAGEAGIGKSRLVKAFTDSLGRGEAHVIEARALSSDPQASYATVRRLARALIDLPDQPGTGVPEAVLQRLEWLGADQRVATPLLSLLESGPQGREWLTTTSGDRARQIRDAFAVLVSLQARRRPLVLVIEDVHWLDELSRDVLDRLRATVRGHALMIVATARPDLLEETFEADTTIRLEALPEPDAIAFAGELIGSDPSIEGLASIVATRAGGVPLFIEEVVGALRQDGRIVGAPGAYRAPAPVTDVPVPPSVGLVIGARIGRLPSEDRRCLEVAAQIGDSFEPVTLAALTGREEAQTRSSLDCLQRAGFLVEESLFPTHRFRFRHALIHAVALLGLPDEAREELHEKMLSRLIEVGAEPESLACNAAAAGRPALAAEYRLQAARLALERSAHHAALHQLSEGLKLFQSLPEGRERWRLELGYQKVRGVALMAAKGWGAREVSDAFERAEMLCAHLGDEAELFTVLRGRAQYYMISGEPQAADEIASRCAALARGSSDEGMAIETHHMGWTNRLFMGDLDGAAFHAGEAIRLYRPERDHELTFRFSGHDPGVCCRCFSGLAHWLKGDDERATIHCEEAVSLARRLSHPLSTALSYWGRGYLEQLKEDPAGTLSWAERGQDLCEEYVLPLLQSHFDVQIGWAMTRSGELSDGIERMRRGIATIKTTGAGMGLPHLLALQAEALGEAGNVPEALAIIEEALATSARRGAWFQHSEVLRIKARLILKTGRSREGEVEHALRRALDTAISQQASPLQSRAARDLARFLEDAKRGQEARDLMARSEFAGGGPSP
jgi:pimeloyl-ACP methyl ester carboxylesterase/tetratricopeptide (TPR) repeat protein